MSDFELIKKYVPKEKQKEALEKLNNGYPVQYIIGNVDFYGLIINVTEDVLIPRFETEYLVEKTIKYFKKLDSSVNKKNILEIGTGSGCISIVLKKNLNANVFAIDINEKAIEIAKSNAELNNVEIDFLIKDIKDFSIKQKFDLIISNPPYVPYGSTVDIKTKYEPQNAIFAEENGLYFYRIILEKTKDNLNSDYLIAFEIGDNEGTEIVKIAKEILNNPYVKIEKDYNDFERFAFITNKKDLFT